MVENDNWGPRRDRWARIGTHPLAYTRRNMSIVHAHALGWAATDIAGVYDLTKQRVCAIIERQAELWRWRRDG